MKNGYNVIYYVQFIFHITYIYIVIIVAINYGYLSIHIRICLRKNIDIYNLYSCLELRNIMITLYHYCYVLNNNRKHLHYNLWLTYINLALINKCIPLTWNLYFIFFKFLNIQIFRWNHSNIYWNSQGN